jgi:hypothetical protein
VPVVLSGTHDRRDERLLDAALRRLHGAPDGLCGHRVNEAKTRPTHDATLLEPRVQRALADPRARSSDSDRHTVGELELDLLAKLIGQKRRTRHNRSLVPAFSH